MKKDSFDIHTAKFWQLKKMLLQFFGKVENQFLKLNVTVSKCTVIGGSLEIVTGAYMAVLYMWEEMKIISWYFSVWEL